MGTLGLDPAVLGDHIAWDIGAAAVARRLSAFLDAPAVLAGYSRLVIDCNRQPGGPESIPAVSDGIAVPGNHDLSETEQAARRDTIFWPYHQTVTNTLARLWHRGTAPVLISVHSFTPRMDGGEERPWDIGVLWNRDPRLAVPLIDHLRHNDDILVGDNEPYSGLKVAYSIDIHGGADGLPNVAVEIRQDNLFDEAGQVWWADVLGEAIAEILDMDNLHRVERF
jgi:predicted N-formylglutamate amidohydrolase